MSSTTSTAPPSAPSPPSPPLLSCAAAPGTAGRAPVTCEVVLYDEHDNAIEGANRRGRIFIRNGAPFSGYTDGRNKQIIDGYMSSGDMGHFDENGLLFVDGRDDDMIVSGGENVFPQEVENLLEERDDVAEVAVVGVDDVEFGKRLRAFIVSEPGVAQDAAEIKQLRERQPGAAQGASRCGLHRRATPKRHRKATAPGLGRNGCRSLRA